MKKKFLIPPIVFIVLLNESLFSGGRTGFKFLTLGTDARAISVSDAVVSSVNDISSVFYNPAGLGYIAGSSLLLSYRTLMVDAQILYGAFAFRTDWVNIGFGLGDFTISNIEVRGLPGEPVGFFSSKSNVLAISISPNFKTGFKIGFSAKFLNEKILVHEQSDYAFDFGFRYDMKLEKVNLFTGMALKNFNLKRSSQKLPSEFSMGTSLEYKLGNNLLLLSTIQYDNFYNDRFNAINLGLVFKMMSVASFNFGYRISEKSDLFSDMPSFGLSLFLRNFEIAYAYLPSSQNFNSSHSLTFITKF